eukprot:jgi/Botrbrau1/5219/Bobra.0172s0083.1
MLVDDAFEEDGEEEETEDLVNQVLDEIGVNLDTELASVPAGGARTKIAAPAAAAAAPQAEALGEGSGPPAGDGIDEDLQARLNNLRKS